MAANYQMEYEGLTFGLGTDIGIEQISGFEDFDVLQGDSGVPRGWGDVAGLHTVNSREVTIQLSAQTDEDFQTILDTFQPVATAGMLVLKEPNLVERFVYARPIGRVFVRNAVHKFKKMAVVRLKLADPRIYARAEESTLLEIYSASGGGFDYDADYGIDFSGAGTGEKILTAGGNTEVHPLIRFYGPTVGTVTAVGLTNVTTGQTLDITSALLTGQILTADMRRIETVDPNDPSPIALGGSTRYGDWTLPRNPFVLALGDNAIRFEITGTSTDAQCVITHRDTWL